MKWSPNVVAGFVANAGFRDKDLIFATAIALSSSDGDDSLVTHMDSSLDANLVGLFQVPDWMLEEPTKSRLTNPVANAKAAFYLWSFSDHSWSWLPTFITGGWQFRLVEAAEACKHPEMGERQVSPIVLVDSSPSRRSATGAIRDLFHAINGFSRSIGH